jgi:hypothetical protein
VSSVFIQHFQMSVPGCPDPELEALVARWLEWDGAPATRAEVEALVAAQDWTELRKVMAVRCH